MLLRSCAQASAIIGTGGADQCSAEIPTPNRVQSARALEKAEPRQYVVLLVDGACAGVQNRASFLGFVADACMWGTPAAPPIRPHGRTINKQEEINRDGIAAAPRVPVSSP